MATERSDQIYSAYLATAEKFDYFVVAVALGLVGYVGADLEITRIGLSSAGLEAISAGLLLLGAFAGFRRLEANISLLKIMHKRLYSEESAGAIADASRKGEQLLNTSTGEVLSTEAAAEKYVWHRTGVEVTSELLDSLATSSSRWYTARNFFILAGLTVLILSKVLPAYL